MYFLKYSYLQTHLYIPNWDDLLHKQNNFILLYIGKRQLVYIVFKYQMSVHGKSTNDDYGPTETEWQQTNGPISTYFYNRCNHVFK